MCVAVAFVTACSSSTGVESTRSVPLPAPFDRATPLTEEVSIAEATASQLVYARLGVQQPEFLRLRSRLEKRCE